MGDTVNLRQWKKRRAKSEAEAAAAQNRAVHGVAKPLRQKLKAEASKSAVFLDGRRLEQKNG
jgi:hypothetical protein